MSGTASPDHCGEAGLRRSLLSLLRGEPPAGDAEAGAAAELLRRHECGGYLHSLWSRAGRAGALPPGWAAALAAAHRKTLVDNLSALADLRRAAGLLAGARLPFLLLKGAAYLADLYDDPGARMLTDIDLLVRPGDAGRAARLLAGKGWRGNVGPQYPESRRFEMVPPGGRGCTFEFHWALGVPFRSRVDQEGVWRRSRPCVVEGVPCARLSDEDSVVFHVLHQADSYFGPSLKWVIDLRQMGGRFRIGTDDLLRRAGAFGARTALYLALIHLEKIFPSAGFPVSSARLLPGPLRLRLLRPHLSADPLDLFAGVAWGRSFHPVRLLMIDRPLDAALASLRVAARPIARLGGRLTGAAAPPWEWPEARS